MGYLISLGSVLLPRAWKLALDCANGSSWNIAKAVFDALGAKDAMSSTPSRTALNINHGLRAPPTSEGLQKFVVENHWTWASPLTATRTAACAVDETGPW